MFKIKSIILYFLCLQLIKGITEVEEVFDVLEGVVEEEEYLINVTMMAHPVQCLGAHHQGGWWMVLEVSDSNIINMFNRLLSTGQMPRRPGPRPPMPPPPPPGYMRGRGRGRGRGGYLRPRYDVRSCIV